MIRTASLIALAALCACGRGEAPRPQAKRESRLGALLKSVGSSPACRTQIPGGWSSSLPVPDGEGRGYKAFFFLVERSDDRKLLVSGPAGEVRFEPGGKVLSCRRLPPPRKKIGPSLGSALAGLSIKELDLRREELLSRLESAAAIYARRGRIGGEGAALAAALREFQPPPLAEDYRRLNPDFWSWLDAAR